MRFAISFTWVDVGFDFSSNYLLVGFARTDPENMDSRSGASGAHRPSGPHAAERSRNATLGILGLARGNCGRMRARMPSTTLKLEVDPFSAPARSPMEGKFSRYFWSRM